MALVMSSQVIAALQDAGVIRRDEHVRRVVIDLRPGHAAVVHVERVGDQKLVSAIPALAGVDVSYGVPEGAKVTVSLDAVGVEKEIAKAVRRRVSRGGAAEL